MIENSRQKFKYLENEMNFYDEIKSIFDHFWRATIEANNNFFGRWESDSKLYLDVSDFLHANEIQNMLIVAHM